MSSCHSKIGNFSGSARKHRIGLGLRRQRHPVPAEFGGAADLVLAAKGTRNQLAAEADAEHRAVLVGEIARQVEQAGEIRAILVVERVLAAAEHHHGIVPGRVVRQRVALIGPAQVEIGARLGKSRTDLAKARIVEILDDQDPHRKTLLT